MKQGRVVFNENIQGQIKDNLIKCSNCGKEKKYQSKIINPKFCMIYNR